MEVIDIEIITPIVGIVITIVLAWIEFVTFCFSYHLKKKKDRGIIIVYAIHLVPVIIVVISAITWPAALKILRADFTAYYIVLLLIIAYLGTMLYIFLQHVHLTCMELLKLKAVPLDNPIKSKSKPEK